MATVDLIMRFDNTGTLYDVQSCGSSRQWLENGAEAGLKGQTPELNARFFRYQWEEDPASEALERYQSADFKGKHILDLYDLREEFSKVLTVLRTRKPVLNRYDRFQVRQGKTLTTIISGYPLGSGTTANGAVVFESDLSVPEQTRKRLSHLKSYAERNS